MNEKNSIAKNTLFLYFRMICIMCVTLYTSRVILNALGTNDYGIYQTVGGIVGVVSFLKNALATGSSRFLTFELGRDDFKKLKTMFSTLLMVHVLLGVIIVIIGEPLGIWYIDTKLNIPEKQILVAKIIYQFSLLTTFFSITQVPYSAVIIAHENLKIYAYVSMIEAMLKLLIAFAVIVSPINRLIYYSMLLCISQILICMIYRIYCQRRYLESRFSYKIINCKILTEVFKFSGWSLFASVSGSLIQNGTVILLTTFFSPTLAASRSIADQVSNNVNQFINNFRTASEPQIVKRYATEDYEGSRQLLLKSTCISFYLLLFISIPVILLAEPLMHLWLGEVPELVVPFVQWTMIQGLIGVFDSSFYVPLYASGRLKENALLAPIIDVLCFLGVYICFKKGSSPLAICYIYVIMALVQGLIEKPILICYIAGYKLREILYVFWKCFIVTIISVPLPWYLAQKCDVNHFINFIFVGMVSCLTILTTVWSVGIDSNDRRRISSCIRNRIKHK